MPEQNIQSEINTNQKIYASNLLRYAASVFDSVIVLLLSFFVLVPFYLDNPLYNIDNVNYLFSLVSFSYSVLLIKLSHATFGKKFFGLEVIMEDGSQIDWTKAFLREVVGKILSSFIFMLGFVWILFDKKRQGWHDKLAKTIVVQIEQVGKGKVIFAWLLVFISLTLPLLLFLFAAFLITTNPLGRL